MLRKIHGIILILHSLLPLIVFGSAAVLLLVFWTNLETELADIKASYSIIKSKIDKSSKQFRQILVNAKDNIQAAVNESGLNDLIAEYRNAQASLEALCNSSSGKAAGSHLPFYRPPTFTPLRLVRIDFEAAQFDIKSNEKLVPLKKAIGDLKDATKTGKERLKGELDNIEAEAKKVGALAARAANIAVNNAKREADRFFNNVTEEAENLFNRAKLEIEKIDKEINKLGQQGCKVVAGPIKDIFTPLLSSSIKPIEHITIAIAELERLKFLQKEIEFFQNESKKIYGMLMNVLIELSALIKGLIYLLVAVIVWIVLYKLAGRVDDFKQGWRMLTD